MILLHRLILHLIETISISIYLRDSCSFGSINSLLADRAFVFAFEPFVNALAMISMLALLKLLNFVTVLEDVHANATRFCILRGVVFETPGYVWDPSNLSCRQACSYLATILFFQLQELLVGHIVGIHVLNSRRLPTFLESFLKHFFFSSRRMILLSHCKHVTHHHLKQHVPFSISFFDLLT